MILVPLIAAIGRRREHGVGGWVWSDHEYLLWNGTCWIV